MQYFFQVFHVGFITAVENPGKISFGYMDENLDQADCRAGK